jgi:hypothetical protein
MPDVVLAAVVLPAVVAVIVVVAVMAVMAPATAVIVVVVCENWWRGEHQRGAQDREGA